MPFATSGAIRLYFEEAGRGTPIVFVHEFMGDFRSWEPQLRYFSRRYRCIAFNARGYPPSDVPASAAKYSQKIATDDIAAVMRHLAISKAHIVGCSMGGYATLYFGLRYSSQVLSLTVIGAGAGSDSAKRQRFLQLTGDTATRFATEGLDAAAGSYRVARNRARFSGKDPRGYREFWRQFNQHSAIGHANTMRGVTMRRPPIYSLKRQLGRLPVPIHLVVGDEDDDLLEPAIFVKRLCPAAQLTVVPVTGHLVNLEEPNFFNEITERFLALVESGRWRDSETSGSNARRRPVHRSQGRG